MIRRVFNWLEHWAFDESNIFIGVSKFLLIITVPVVAVFGLVALLGGPSAESCLSSGRGWAIVGSHTEVRFDPALKMALPTHVTDYGCLEVRR